MKKLIYITCSVLTVTIFNLSIMSQSWNWYEDQLSYARWGLTATTLDDTIFYSGGKNTSASFTNIWDIYDIGTDQWSTVELSSAPRWNAVMISANGKVFCAGGSNYDGLNNYSDVDIYDKETGEWTIDHLSLGRTFYYGSLMTFGNEVWFAGGHRHITASGPMEYTNLIDIYNTETNTWTTDTLSIPRCFMGGVVAGGKVFFAGGVTGEQTVTNVIDIYDINTGEWSVDSLSEPRALVAAVAHDNKVYFAGGAKPNQITSTIIDIYNIENGTWDSTMNLQNSRIVTALKVKNSLLFTGIWNSVNLSGPLYFGPLNGVVEIYYPETEQWDYSVSNLNPPRMLYAYTSYENKAYYGGGAAAGYNPVSTVSILVDESYCLPEGITFSTQTQIDSFQINHPYCTEVEGDVEINGDDITNLNGLNGLISLGGFLTIHGNDVLTSLSGLNNIVSIEGSLTIGGYYSEINPVLNSLSGLEGLVSIGGSLFILNNNMITNTSGLNNLNSIGEGISIVSNDLLNSIASLNNLTLLPEHLIIMANQSLTSFMGLDNLTSIGGTVELGGNASMNNLSGLENISIIGGDLKIGSVGIGQNLTSLTGLDGLISISGNLNIGYIIGTFPVSNPLLSSLNGLNNLTSVGGGLTIMNNDTLISLAGLDSLSTIGIGITNDGGLFIGNNNSLSSLTELHNLTNIGGNLGIRENNTLVSLLGLENINSGSIINLSIFGNNSLSNCDAQSICDYLAEPNGTITIDNNATGCNSEQEVQDDCDSITYIEELIIEELFTLSPNPVSGAVHLRFTIPKASGNNFGLTICDLYELSGVKVRQLVSEEKMSGTYEMEIDLSDLKTGIYFCVLKTPQYTETKKIIKLP